MIPMFASTEDHVAAGGLSYVWSLELEIATRDCRRRIETTQTLMRQDVSGCNASVYNVWKQWRGRG